MALLLAKEQVLLPFDLGETCVGQGGVETASHTLWVSSNSQVIDFGDFPVDEDRVEMSY